MRLLASINIPTVPVAQPRQRHRVAMVRGRAMAMNYTPTKDPVNAYKAALQAAACAVLSAPSDKPLCVSMTFVMDRPKKLLGKKSPAGRLPYNRKPDIDNFLKSTMDALNGFVWCDDSQIGRVVAEKWYRAKDETPCVTLQVFEMEDEQC